MHTSLLIKKLFLGREDVLAEDTIVLVSTTFYAAAAVALDTRIFAREKVLFSSQGALRLFLNRKTFLPRSDPRASDALLIVALHFPANFYFSLLLGQALLSGREAPSPAALLGSFSWLLALQVVAWQGRFWSYTPDENLRLLEGLLERLPPWLTVAVIALTPALCEEHLFRGFLLGGLRGLRRKGLAVLLVGLCFAVYHLPFYRQPVTFLLEVVLAFQGINAVEFTLNQAKQRFATIRFQQTGSWPKRKFKHILDHGFGLFHRPIQDHGISTLVCLGLKSSG